MKKYIVILLLGLVTNVVSAQEGSTIFVNYLVGMPLGETADFTDNISPRGIDFEANRFLKEDLSVGFNIAWSAFRQKVPESTFLYQDLTITGTQFRYTNVVPINVNVKKYFTNTGNYVPYLGVGVGTSYNERRNEVGIFQEQNDKWLFNVAPELGMLYDMNYKTYLTVKVKYNYSPKSGDFASVSYLSLGVGIGIK